MKRIHANFTHKGLRAAALADGMIDPEVTPGPFAKDCWRVAYFVRPAQFSKKGDHHWVREDSPGNWSHKPGSGNATDQQFNPDTRKYDGGKLTDPSKQNVGAGYKFCGYLIVCPPKVQIASLLPEDVVPEGEGVLLSDARDSTSLDGVFATNFRPDDICAHINALSEHIAGPWFEGVGEGQHLYRLDVLAHAPLPGRFALDPKTVTTPGSGIERPILLEKTIPNPFDLRLVSRLPRRRWTVLVSDTSLSVIDTEERHLADPEGIAAAHFARLLGLDEDRLPEVQLTPDDFTIDSQFPPPELTSQLDRNFANLSEG